MRTFTALATAALATAAIVPAAAGGAPKPPTTVTLAGAPNPVVAGQNVTLSGKLSGDKVANQKVTVRSDPFPFDAFAPVGTATTTATGDFSLIQSPTLNTRYRAHVGNDESAIVTVLVRPKVGLRLGDATPEAGQRVRFSGRVCPAHDGTSVAIQRHSGARFRTIRRVTLRDIPSTTCSSYRRAIRVASSGRYRTLIRGHGDHARGISPTRRADVSSN